MKSNKLKKSKISRRFRKNKGFFQKKSVFYPVTILIFTIFILIAALSSTFKKTSHEKKLGEEQIGLIKTYQDGEDILLYIDQSAKYSIYESLYPFAKNGTYFNAPICNLNPENDIGYIMWENIIQDKDTQCYPTEKDIVINFASFLNKQLDRYFEKYPFVKIPQDNYDFIFNNTDTEIIGIATRNIVIVQPNATYSLKPSFRTKLSYNLITKFTGYSSKAKEIRDNIQNCLKDGSSAPDDKEDLLTCSDINKLKKEIEGIEDYQITPVSLPKNYTLLFDITDPSFKNPYSGEKLTIKFGIRFLDTFPPPATEIITEDKAEERADGKYITWKKNNASDVISYRIYARNLEPSYIDETNFKFETGIKTEWKIEHQTLQEGQAYYFYIIAKDSAGNTAKGILPKPITI